jgi:hypothetical protein
LAAGPVEEHPVPTVSASQVENQKVADVYLEALELGLPVIDTVSQVFALSRRQARYVLQRTRRAGHLGRAHHHPAKAVIHRNTTSEHSWIVCERCLRPWPCGSAFPDGFHTALPTT